MSAPLDWRDRYAYHFTHIEGLAKVLTDGELRCDNDVQAAGGCVEVGDQDLKAARRRKAVPCGPGGVVADYVPFYLASKSPMLFRIATKWNVPRSDGEEPLVFMATTMGTVMDLGLPFVFTDGHPIAAFTDYFDDPAQVSEIDWALMLQRDWNNTNEDPDRQRRRQAEFMVYKSLPLSAIVAMAARSDRIAARATEIVTTLGYTLTVAVRPDWYYNR